MRRRRFKWDYVSLGVITVTAVGGGLLWQFLPGEVAIHFSFSGRPGNYVSRTVAVVVMPVLMLLTLLVMKGVACIDPPNDSGAFAIIVCSTMLLLATVQAFVLAWNLGHPVPFVLLPLVTGVWTVFVVGYSLRHEGF